MDRPFGNVLGALELAAATYHGSALVVAGSHLPLVEVGREVNITDPGPSGQALVVDRPAP